MQFKVLISALSFLSFGAANSVVDTGIDKASNFLSNKYLSDGANATVASENISNVLKTVADSPAFGNFASAASTQIKASASSGFNMGQMIDLVGLFTKALTGFMSSVNYDDWLKLAKAAASDINISAIVSDATKLLRNHAPAVAKAVVMTKKYVDSNPALSDAISAAATPAKKLALDMNKAASIATTAEYTYRTTSAVY